jgi:hypothetical protein
VTAEAAVRRYSRRALKITVIVVLVLLLGLAGAWRKVVADTNTTYPISAAVGSPDRQTLEFEVEYGSCHESIGYASVDEGRKAIWLRGVIRLDRRQPFHPVACAGVGLRALFAIRLREPLGDRKVFDRYDGRVIPVKISGMNPVDPQQIWIVRSGPESVEAVHGAQAGGELRSSAAPG